MANTFALAFSIVQCKPKVYVSIVAKSFDSCNIRLSFVMTGFRAKDFSKYLQQLCSLHICDPWVFQKAIRRTAPRKVGQLSATKCFVRRMCEP